MRLFYQIAMALAVLWLLGLLSQNRLGGLIHVLPLAALVLVLVGLASKHTRP